MVDSQETEKEPSIEEILDSIRQIISDDDVDEAPKASPPPPEPEPIMDEPEPVYIPEPMNEPEPEPFEEDNIIDLTDVIEDFPEPEPEEIKFTPEPEPVFSAPEPPPTIVMQEPTDVEALFTRKAESVALDAFSTLNKRAAVEKTNRITVEDIVREELRPILRTWIDENLPPLLERLLQEELDKITKRAMEE